MIKGRNFIITSLQSWDVNIGSNAIDIAKTISKDNRVLYINTPLDYITYKHKPNFTERDVVYRREVIKGDREYLRKINENLFVLDIPFTIMAINFLPDGPIFDFFNKINNKRVFSFVNKILKELNFTNNILFVDNDIYRSFYAKEYLKPSLTVYYRRDNLVSPFWAKHAKRLEPLICKKSDLIVGNSIYLINMIKDYNKNAYDVGQGVDLDDYIFDKSYNKPLDIIDIPRPIVGYTGWLTSLRLDADLIYNIAKELSNISFIFVGSEDDVFLNHKIHTLDNVYFTGVKDPKLMPAYINTFDACINPQLINDITQGNYPRKIDEYLAMGKSVVATKTEGMKMFNSYVYNCIGQDEYINAIKKAIHKVDDSVIKDRVDFANTHTWENSVNKIYNYINETIK